MNEQKQKWIETNDQVCALLRQAHDILALSSLPLKREWQGLTDEDKQIAFDDTQEGGGFWEFADAIEAKLKEKNT